MALIDSLKNFYKDNVDDINKLNDADSVLEVLRAKYGDYKGSNVEEYIKELVNNDITPGGSTPTGTISITENGEGIDVSSYAYADVNVSGGGGGDIGTIVTVTLSTTEAYFNGTPVGTAVEAMLYIEGTGWVTQTSLSSSDTSLTVVLIEESAYCITVYSEPTVTGDATVKKSELYDEWEITVSGDCTITT